jgi:signal transduction histidine kinase
MIASHELLTPLTILKLNVQLAQSRLEKGAPPEPGLLSRVDSAIARIETLIGDLLRTSRIERGELSFRAEPCDLCEICRSAAEHHAASSHRAITLDLPEGRVEAIVDPHGIEHVIGSLLSNALKFSSADKPVTLSLRRSETEAKVRVSDEGAGIPADELPRLFQRFHRVPGVEVQVGSRLGLGLGLYISKAIVDMHGGRIEVESTVGKGSTFTVVLPFDAVNKAALEP